MESSICGPHELKKYHIKFGYCHFYKNTHKHTKKAIFRIGCLREQYLVGLNLFIALHVTLHVFDSDEFGAKSSVTNNCAICDVL